jgi:formylglycine-generating enzyme required for sulfatase activity
MLKTLSGALLVAMLVRDSVFCASTDFAPTTPNKNTPPGKAPEGMVWIPGGEFSMGAVVNGEGSDRIAEEGMNK